MHANAALVSLAAFVTLALAYVVYGRFLATHIFKLSNDNTTPANTYEDGVDFVPTRPPVLFGHHFASIAGLGPVLGPAIAVIWGWLPAVLWVVFGSIFLGAVHDLGALSVSLRYQGRSIGDVTRELIGARARLLFLLIIFFLLALAMGVFVLVISQLFVYYYPNAIAPSFGLMFVAVAMGISVYKFKMPLMPLSLAGIAILFLLIHMGVRHPLPTYAWNLAPAQAEEVEALFERGAVDAPYGADALTRYLDGAPDTAPAVTGTDIRAAAAKSMTHWTALLLFYSFLASVLPVWLLLQPRDYLNSYQLYAGLILLLVGLFTLHPEIAAPAIADAKTIGAPPLFPFLFITVACGAISGFHSLVSSGTTVRQLRRERDALPIGFGAMLTEGALAVLVIMACVAGLGQSHWGSAGIYAHWSNLSGKLGAQLAAVVQGSGTFLSAIGISPKYGEAFIAVAIVAFALTTLDSATRLLRYNVEEIFRCVGLARFANRYTGSLIAIIAIGFFACLRINGKPAGITLWTLFGTTNQLLAGLTLLAVSLFLFKLRRPIIYTLLPMFGMLGISLYAMVTNLIEFLHHEIRNWSLISVSIVILIMTVWMLIEAVISFSRGRGGIGLKEDAAAPASP
ncbi:MAG: carbon starvation protein A [Verrucomicrobia bacterium]|nr:carbon starvation protein A [Verrucomicrobiota bacterium]